MRKFKITNPTDGYIDYILNKGFHIVGIKRNGEDNEYTFEKMLESDEDDEDEIDDVDGCENCPSLSKKILINPEAEDINRLYQLNYTTEKITTSPNGDIICLLSRCDSDNEENLGIKEVKISYFDGSVDIINHIDGADLDIDEGMFMAFGEYHAFVNEDEGEEEKEE